MLSKPKALWRAVPDSVKRVLHTAWQAGAAFVTYAVFVKHVPLHSVSDIQTLGFAAIGAAFATLKSAFIALVVSRS